jgi:hypothetical protein
MGWSQEDCGHCYLSKQIWNGSESLAWRLSATGRHSRGTVDNDPAVRCIWGKAQQPVTYGSVAAACVHRSITPCIHMYIGMSVLAKHGERYGSYGCYVPRNMQCMPGGSCRYAVVRTN